MLPARWRGPVRDADASRKSVRDAAEAGREAIRSGGEAIGQTTERASETASSDRGQRCR